MFIKTAKMNIYFKNLFGIPKMRAGTQELDQSEQFWRISVIRTPLLIRYKCYVTPVPHLTKYGPLATNPQSVFSL